jgi:hypothetical protein
MSLAKSTKKTEPLGGTGSSYAPVRLIGLGLIPWAVATFFATPANAIWVLAGALLWGVITYLVLRVAPASNQSIALAAQIDAQAHAQAEKERAQEVEQGAIEHLSEGLVKMTQARQAAEVAVIKIAESLTKLGELQTRQMHWIKTQAAPRLSRSGALPESVQHTGLQIQSEISRMIAALQFHDLLSQTLQSARNENFGGALELLKHKGQSNTELLKGEQRLAVATDEEQALAYQAKVQEAVDRANNQAALFAQQQKDQLDQLLANPQFANTNNPAEANTLSQAEALKGAITPIRRGEVEMF